MSDILTANGIPLKEVLKDWMHSMFDSYYYGGPLTENGILLENGTIVTEGKGLEFAREAKRLLENRDYKGFMKLYDQSVFGRMDYKESRLFHATKINSENDLTIIEIRRNIKANHVHVL
jgi:hypothetical protein